MTLIQHQALFLLQTGDLIRFASELGFLVTGGELWRTEEQQKFYVQNGRSKTFNSQHLKRLAIDLNFFWKGELTYDRELIAPVGAHWESLDELNVWGGNWKNFKDIPHFERRV